MHQIFSPKGQYIIINVNTHIFIFLLSAESTTKNHVLVLLPNHFLLNNLVMVDISLELYGDVCMWVMCRRSLHCRFLNALIYLAINTFEYFFSSTYLLNSRMRYHASTASQRFPRAII